MKAPADFVIRAYRSDDEARILDLLRGGFGTWPRDIGGVDASEFFHWKHMDNPFGSSLLLVAESGDELVGFAAWLRWRLASGQRTYEALRGVDFVVRPAHRGRGIPVALIRSATERFPPEVDLTFSGPNERSRSGAVKSGRRKVGMVRDFFRPRRPLRGVLRSRRRGGGPQAGELPVKAGTAGRLLEEGADVTRLLDAAHPPENRFATARDLEYLRWRYGRFEDYRAVRYEAEGRLAGLGIFRLHRRGAAVVARVCELIGADDRRIARRLLRSVSRAARPDFLTCAFRTRGEAAACGFVQAPGGLLLVAHPLREALHPDPMKVGSWELSVGDLELL